MGPGSGWERWLWVRSGAEGVRVSSQTGSVTGGLLGSGPKVVLSVETKRSG